jgi:hypothetical protein
MRVLWVWVWASVGVAQTDARLSTFSLSVHRARLGAVVGVFGELGLFSFVTVAAENTRLRERRPLTAAFLGGVLVGVGVTEGLAGDEAGEAK